MTYGTHTPVSALVRALQKELDGLPYDAETRPIDVEPAVKAPVPALSGERSDAAGEPTSEGT